MNDLADSLRGQGELPEKFSEIEVSPKADELELEREEKRQRQLKDGLKVFVNLSKAMKLRSGLTQAEKEQIEEHSIRSKKKLVG